LRSKGNPQIVVSSVVQVYLVTNFQPQSEGSPESFDTRSGVHSKVGPAAANLPTQGEYLMQGESTERWQRLCEEAAMEQNSDRLMKLIKEICEMLEAKQERLQQPGEKGTNAA